MRPRLPRTPVLALAALVLAALPSAFAAAQVKFVRVWPEYRAAASFTRITEYFGGEESAPEAVIRTQPAARAGYYFLTRLESGQTVPGAILTLEYFVPGDDRARVQFFTVDLPKGSRAFMFGLTGSDWPDAELTPTAWRFRLLSADGAEIAREQSFLWAMPAAPASADTPATAASAAPAS